MDSCPIRAFTLISRTVSALWTAGFDQGQRNPWYYSPACNDARVFPAELPK